MNSNVTEDKEVQHKTTYFPTYIAYIYIYIYIYIYAATSVLETTFVLSHSHKLSSSWSNLYHYVLLETELKFVKMINIEYRRPSKYVDDYLITDKN